MSYVTLPQQPSPSPSFVLVVDDEYLIRDLLRRVVQQLGLGVHYAADGAAAISAVEAQRDALACVIMDVVMPVMHGIAAAQIIQTRAPQLPIVLMSGAIPEMYQAQLAPLRLAGFLAKPFSLTAVRDLIGGAVDSRQRMTHSELPTHAAAALP